MNKMEFGIDQLIFSSINNATFSLGSQEMKEDMIAYGQNLFNTILESLLFPRGSMTA